MTVALTRSADEIPGFTLCRTPEAAAALAQGRDAFVIGGGSVYRALLPYCTRAYITKVHACPASDAFLPDLDEDREWQLQEVLRSGEENGIQYEMCLYTRTAP